MFKIIVFVQERGFKKKKKKVSLFSFTGDKEDSNT